MESVAGEWIVHASSPRVGHGQNVCRLLQIKFLMNAVQEPEEETFGSKSCECDACAARRGPKNSKSSLVLERLM